MQESMEESMKKLLHNVELLIVTTGKGNWRSAAEAVSKARLLLDEIERELQAEARGRDGGAVLGGGSRESRLV